MKFDMMSKEEQDTYIRHLDAIANEKEAILTAKIWGKIEGIKEGKAEGEKIGIEERNKELSLSMKVNGMSVETVSCLVPSMQRHVCL